MKQDFTDFVCEARLVIHRRQLTEILDWMSQRGSSVILNWGEDSNAWECSWITGGDRFTSFDVSPCTAAVKAIEKCLEHEGKNA